MGIGLCNKLYIGLIWWIGGNESRLFLFVGIIKIGDISNGFMRFRV